MKSGIILLFSLMCTYWVSAQEYSLELQDLDPSKFDMSFEGYDQATALFCIQLSNLVYHDKGEIDSKVNLLRLMYPSEDIRYLYIQEDNEDYPLSNVQTEKLNSLEINKNIRSKKRKRTESELIFFGTKKFVVIVYRGSDSFRDWKTNFRLSKRHLVEDHEHNSEYRSLPSGHRGYRDAMKNLMDNHRLFEKLEQFIGYYTKDVASFPVFTTGHSSGAGMAILSIKPLQYNNDFNYKGTYTFAPALAITHSDKHLFDEVKDRIFNVINYADIVARKNYSYLTHIGSIYRFSRYNRKLYTKDDGVLYFEKEEKSIKFTLSERFHFLNTVLKYHQLDRYIERIKLTVNASELVKERYNALD